MAAKQNLPIIETVLREAGGPLRVAQIVDMAGDRLRTCSTAPRNVLAKELALDIRDNPHSLFKRLEPGLFALKED
jgi:hypothetical protein